MVDIRIRINAKRGLALMSLVPTGFAAHVGGHQHAHGAQFGTLDVIVVCLLLSLHVSIHHSHSSIAVYFTILHCLHPRLALLIAFAHFWGFSKPLRNFGHKCENAPVKSRSCQICAWEPGLPWILDYGLY